MKGLGTGVKSFKDGMKGVTDVEDDAKEEKVKSEEKNG
jgi:Sec-independent protein translocase protein TatA